MKSRDAVIAVLGLLTMVLAMPNVAVGQTCDVNKDTIALIVSKIDTLNTGALEKTIIAAHGMGTNTADPKRHGELFKD
jgi:hypothetical protein